MDRKTMIASFDILSKNFADDDPYGVELKAMAKAASEQTDEEFELHFAAETFPCPTCGTKVLSKTKYCVKCKKKVEPKGGDKEAAEEMCPCGCGMPKSKCPKNAPAAPAKAGGFEVTQMDRKASDAFFTAVRRTLIAEATDDDDDDETPPAAAKPVEKTADQNSPHPQLEGKMPPAIPEPAPVAAVPAPAPAAPAPAPVAAAPAPAPVPPVAPVAAVPAPVPAPAKEVPPAAQPTASNVVPTDVLSFEGIGLTSAAMTDADTVMTAEEKQTLASIMGTGGFDGMTANEKAILDGLLKK